MKSNEVKKQEHISVRLAYWFSDHGLNWIAWHIIMPLDKKIYDLKNKIKD